MRRWLEPLANDRRYSGFAALDVHTGLVQVGHYHRKRRREFLDFMNRVVAQHPETELHVVLDDLSTHKPKHDRWLARHPLVHFHCRGVDG